MSYCRSSNNSHFNTCLILKFLNCSTYLWLFSSLTTMHTVFLKSMVSCYFPRTFPILSRSLISSSAINTVSSACLMFLGMFTSIIYPRPTFLTLRIASLLWLNESREITYTFFNQISRYFWLAVVCISRSDLIISKQLWQCLFYRLNSFLHRFSVAPLYLLFFMTLAAVIEFTLLLIIVKNKI